jgi:hypothetical protein
MKMDVDFSVVLVAVVINSMPSSSQLLNFSPSFFLFTFQLPHSLAQTEGAKALLNPHHSGKY